MRYLKELKKIKLPRNQYAIFGSGPLAIRNIRKSKDIDIIVKKKLWNKLIKKYKVRNGKIKIGNVEIFKDWLGFKNVNKLIADVDIFKNIRFVKLKYVISWKKKRNKEKDKRDIKLINKYIKNKKMIN